MDGDIEYYLAYHFPTNQYIRLQECEHCYAIVLRGGCPNNCPELDTVDEDVSLLHYVLDNIGDLILTNETATAAWLW